MDRYSTGTLSGAIAKMSLAGLALCLLAACGHGKHVAGVGADDSSASDGGISTSLNDSLVGRAAARPHPTKQPIRNCLHR